MFLFIFTTAWGNDAIWRAYFSKGLKPLKPPTVRRPKQLPDEPMPDTKRNGQHNGEFKWDRLEVKQGMGIWYAAYAKISPPFKSTKNPTCFACFHLFGWQPIDWNFGVDSNNMGQKMEFMPFGRVNQPQRNLLFISQSFWPLNSNQCLCGPKELRFSLFFGGFSPHILIRHTKKNKAFLGNVSDPNIIARTYSFLRGSSSRIIQVEVYMLQMSRDFLIDKRIYQEVDIDHGGCRHFPWGRRRA